ncbi:MAG: S-adenosylmethionine decarboxylase [Bacilli bacterium]|jgi:S-adenosylmethionine decarboxylase|nr:S-adenosylmethionine decarboxylase [Bacilli bacterium]MDD3389367.1 S-adenosylmethionine decarboxylase [Bacilli bacterium]MDD4345232.1 S-adenosylmethionine decarboxylase [Bacilli bacterium]MDD4520933.1 S-adenosylmethionine decarboxylase [Bacilli bacterium]MDY0400045.1 S-adenosylmethionine decarboxylase [Bacilli bacterium]
MKHTTLDAYNSNPRQLDDIKLIYEVLTTLAYKLKLNAICPPQIVPYYYGKVKKDIGVSGFILLEGGHITIHTFPLRECYFLDVFSVKDFDPEIIENYLSLILPYTARESLFIPDGRRTPLVHTREYHPASDFGPHVMVDIQTKDKIDMEKMSDFLEQLVPDIGMDPITRSYVLKSSIRKPKFLTGIIVIAQSHISMHYEYKTGKLYFDVFSCRAFDTSVLDPYLAMLGENKFNILVPRGSDHIDKVKANHARDEFRASGRWQRQIRK